MAEILVAEDEADIAMILREILEMAGHNVTLAVDGAMALELLESGPLPDIILADLKMPRMSGRRLIETLRSDRRTTALPVILVTGAIPNTDDFPPDGSYDYLIMKPFDIWDVVDTVDRIAGRCGF
ncbi:MAG: response regulator [Bacillota bacterium]